MANDIAKFAKCVIVCFAPIAETDERKVHIRKWPRCSVVSKVFAVISFTQVSHFEVKYVDYAVSPFTDFKYLLIKRVFL